MKNSQLKRFKFVCSIRWNIIRLLKIATIWKTAHQSTVFTRSLNFSNFIRCRIVKLLTICISNEVKSLFFITSLFSATFEQFYLLDLLSSSGDGRGPPLLKVVRGLGLLDNRSHGRLLFFHVRRGMGVLLEGQKESKLSKNTTNM